MTLSTPRRPSAGGTARARSHRPTPAPSSLPGIGSPEPIPPTPPAHRLSRYRLLPPLYHVLLPASTVLRFAICYLLSGASRFNGFSACWLPARYPAAVEYMWRPPAMRHRRVPTSVICTGGPFPVCRAHRQRPIAVLGRSLWYFCTDGSGGPYLLQYAPVITG